MSQVFVGAKSSLEVEAAALRADNARLREALEAVVAEGDRVQAYLENEVFILRHHMRVAWLASRTALASTDASTWLRERERRVAERVLKAIDDFIRGFEDGLKKKAAQDRGSMTRMAVLSMLKELKLDLAALLGGGE